MFYWQIRQLSLGFIEFQQKYIRVQERRIHFQSSHQFWKSPASLFSEIYTFVSCQYDVFCVFCTFYWQIRQLSLGYIQFQEELHISKERRIHFQCSDQFSNLQLVYFQRYTRLYPVNAMFFVCFACLVTNSSIFARFHWVSVKVHPSTKKKNTFPV